MITGLQQWEARTESKTFDYNWSNIPFYHSIPQIKYFIPIKKWWKYDIQQTSKFYLIKMDR